MDPGMDIREDYMKETLSDKQKALLPQMISSFLLVPQQSESAQENVHKLLDMLDEPTQLKLFLHMKADLKGRLDRQKSLIQQQIDALEV